MLTCALGAVSCTLGGTTPSPHEPSRPPPASTSSSAPAPVSASTLSVGKLAFIAAARGDRVLFLYTGSADPNVVVGPHLALAGVSMSSEGQVAYAVGQSEGRAEIRITNLNRTPGAYTVPAVGADQWPAWSPRGLRIAFGDGRRIDVFTPTNHHLRRITKPGRCADLFPTWEPGGGKLAFYRDCDTGAGSGVYEVGAGGRGEIRILAGPRRNGAGPWQGTSVEGNPTGLSWSPDGASVALTTSDGSLWLVPARVVLNQASEITTGSAVRLVGPESPTSSGPYGAVSWSPDGREIAFIRDGAIYEINPSTRQVQLVAGTAGMNPIALSWR